VKLKACPFCGSIPNVEPWHGGKRTKRLIFCSNESCAVHPGVTGETMREAASSWNTRHKDDVDDTDNPYLLHGDELERAENVRHHT